MTDYIKYYTNPSFPFQQQEAERLITKFEGETTVIDGVVRWVSNGSVPPEDILELWSFVGFAYFGALCFLVLDNALPRFKEPLTIAPILDAASRSIERLLIMF